MDLDGDGRTDIVSGSWPGEIYWFRRQAGGTFAEPEILKDKWGEPINVGQGATAFFVDWNGDGGLDLLVGTFKGSVHLIPNEGSPARFAFGKPQPLTAGGRPIERSEGEAAPFAADWDGDGRLDLLLGTAEGAVLWYRNVGTGKRPELESARVLIPEGTVGLKVKLCVVDWNGNGRLDILLGGCGDSYEAKPHQTAEEIEEQRHAARRLPTLQKSWAAAFRQYRRLQAARAQAEAAGDDDPELQPSLEELRDEMQRLKVDISETQATLKRYTLQRQTHGYVWLFKRAE